jgi:catechol 2,3-dioxygenase-like lactoylglutathione lyase family enzyme
MVTDIEASRHFYVDRLGFAVTQAWRPDKASGRIQWCRLQLGNLNVRALRCLVSEAREGGPRGESCPLWHPTRDARVGTPPDARASDTIAALAFS